MEEKDETFGSRLFFVRWRRGWGMLPERGCSERPLPSKIFKKKFFRVGMWGGFEWVGGVGNSGDGTK